VRRRLSATLLAALLACLCISASAVSSASANSSFYAIVPQVTLKAKDYRQIDRANAGTVRLILNWSSIQPTKSTTNWAYFDAQVKMAADRGIKILPFLYGSPDWIGGCSHDCGTHPPSTRKALSRWKHFVGLAAKRYGPGGVFWQHYDGKARPIRVWQVWNEQNSKTFFTPKPSPKIYARVLDKASKAIRARDRKAEIVLGGMFGTPGGGHGNHAIAAADYLRKLYKISGAKHDFDGIALHPYARSIDSVKLQVQLARHELRRAHDSKTDLWITELGWASGGKPNPLNVGSKKAQAQRLTDAFKMFHSHRQEWNVRLVSWFSWQDSHASDSFCFFCDKSGLVTGKGKKKPAYSAFKRLAR